MHEVVFVSGVFYGIRPLRVWKLRMMEVRASCVHEGLIDTIANRVFIWLMGDCGSMANVILLVKMMRLFGCEFFGVFCEIDRQCLWST